MSAYCLILLSHHKTSNIKVFPIYEMDISYVLYMFLHVPSFGGAPFQILKPKQKQIFFLNSLGGPGIGDAAYTTKYRLFVGNVLA